MATQADVRRIALSLPGAEQEANRFAFAVLNKDKLRAFAWVWRERPAPKKPRVPNPGVIAVRVANLGQKDLMIAAEPAKFFTEPHYNGFPAVLVRLDAASIADLELLIAEAWRCQAPVELTKAAKADVRGRARGSRASPVRASRPGKNRPA